MKKISAIVIIIITAFSGLSEAQMSKSEVRKIMILQGMENFGNFEAKVDKVYDKYLDRISFKPKDLLGGMGFSLLSGLCLGTYESHEFGYKNSTWLPGFLRNWYDSSPRISYEPMYGLFNIQTIAREGDYISDRNAYEKWKRFFRGEWYWALLAHWVIKNTVATIVRDKFNHDHLFYSFRIDFLISVKN